MKNSPPSSRPAFLKAANPNQPEKPEEKKDDQVKHVSDPMKFTMFGTQGGKSKLIVEDQDGTLQAEFIPDEEQKRPINMSTEDATLEWPEDGYNIVLKLEEDPHKAGLDGGKISRLAMKGENGEEVYFANGEWQKAPNLPIEYALVDKIKNDLNATPERPAKDPNQLTLDTDPDHGI